ncbi:transglutaminase-like domain-containing protein [Microbacterium allomyrinae]|uniref:Transglutaminase family protein n=1 Tax=Microbacterium allomyrinae TaxID=2830666 RepID=A0A9X1S3L0_9MICO|nr:transglutaminase family protein [Microbacterium allomyrinae]MCC2033299.1 transglutaminase family protein [Microbacterium allomyrinae]
MKRDVAAHIELSVTETADLIFSVAVASTYEPSAERLALTLDGHPLEVIEFADDHGTRLHRVEAPPGILVLDYTATIDGTVSDSAAGEAGPTANVPPAEPVRYTRPSRYAESDTLAPTAAAEFHDIPAGPDLLAAVSSWVGTRLAYVSGSSLPTDGAVRTLLSRQGVCRDFAHLTIALLRARNVPARLVSVYAPGLSPMDFHAVAEAWIGGEWRVVDATALAPRDTLVRIATGRDAADTAFLTVLSGRSTLQDFTVTATAGTLPKDDVNRLVSIS